MIIGERLRALREEKKLSQGELERRTGLLRCYLSRVENGHTVPAIETLEKLAKAMGMPLYRFFCERNDAPQTPELKASEMIRDAGWGSTGKDARLLFQFRRLLARIREEDRRFLLFVAQRMARKSPVRAGSTRP